MLQERSPESEPVPQNDYVSEEVIPDEAAAEIRAQKSPRAKDEIKAEKAGEALAEVPPALEIVTVETPRTKLKNDLKKLADEITADFEDSEMETADEVDSQDLSAAAHDQAEDDHGKVPDIKTDHGNEDDVTLRKTDSRVVLIEEFRGPLPVAETIERKLSKLLVCENKPSILSLEGQAGFKTPSLPSVDSDARSVPVRRPTDSAFR